MSKQYQKQKEKWYQKGFKDGYEKCLKDNGMTEKLKLNLVEEAKE